MFVYSIKILSVIILLATCACASTSTPEHVRAFPTAEGFGAFATGGRGGEIRHVTNLNDSGPGSFRDAVSKSNAIVVFDVAGSINLKSTINAQSNLTIAGQSAPGQGVCFNNYMVSFSGAHNDIVRYLRFRVGTITHQDHKYAVGMYGSHDMIYDHCSIEWAGWDCIGMTAASNITVQYCIIGPGVEPQRFGCLCESDNVTFSHNLWISNKSRNPKAKGLIQYVNNIVYNWGVCGLVGGHSARDHQLDVINNCFIKGPDSGDRFTGEYADTDKVYQSGNLVDLSRNGQLEGRPAVADDFSPAVMVNTIRMIPTAPVTLDSAVDAYNKVIASAGASLHRDAVDLALIEDVRSLGKKGQLVADNPAGAEYKNDLPIIVPQKVSSADGIPDFWKTSHHLSLTNQSVATQIGHDGYSNIEHYINDLATAGS